MLLKFKMAIILLSSSLTKAAAFPKPCQPAPPGIPKIMKQPKSSPTLSVSAAKSGGFFSLSPFMNRCQTCRGKGAIECPGCKGTGKNKKNGNIFERWKCFDCQGFGLQSCPNCGQGGLTPEQRGER